MYSRLYIRTSFLKPLDDTSIDFLQQMIILASIFFFSKTPAINKI